MTDKTYEEVIYNKNLYATILSSGYTNDKTIFFSSPEFSQQLGYIVYKKDGIIKPHFHKEVLREITLTQEVLFIKKGKTIINFYTIKKSFLGSKELNQGDVIFLCSGGHGFEMLEDTEMVEVKQGPYSGKEGDKVVFEGVENDSCK